MEGTDVLASVAQKPQCYEKSEESASGSGEDAVLWKDWKQQRRHIQVLLLNCTRRMSKGWENNDEGDISPRGGDLYAEKNVYWTIIVTKKMC